MRVTSLIALASFAKASRLTPVGTECKIDNGHTKRISSPEGDDFNECLPWRLNSCCTAEIASKIEFQHLYDADDAWDMCGSLTQACERFFSQESCFYECDPNVGRYLVGDSDWQVQDVPIRGDFADSFFHACRHDTLCFDNDNGLCGSWNLPDGMNYTQVPGSDLCKKVGDVFSGAEEFISQIFWGSFKYEADVTKGMTMWFVEDENPNDVIGRPTDDACPLVQNEFMQSDLSQPGAQCHLDYFHLDVSAPFDDSEQYTECHPWRENACCHGNTTSGVVNGLYGNDTKTIDICGDISPVCRRFFIQEECFYECDPNAGLFRKHASDCQGEECNEWEMEGMPIRGDYAWQWFQSCAADSICVGDDKSLWSCDKTAPTCKTVGDEYQDAKDFIDNIYGGAFVYSDDMERAYTMWFDQDHNPNDDVSQCLFTAVDQPQTTTTPPAVSGAAVVSWTLAGVAAAVLSA